MALTASELVARTKKISAERQALMRDGRKLTEREAADALANYARVFLEAHRRVKTRKEAQAVGNALEAGIFNMTAEMRDGRLKEILKSGHGVAETTLAVAYNEMRTPLIRDIFLYNYFHWTSIAALSGAKVDLSEFKSYLRRQGFDVTSEGRIHLTPRSLNKLVSTTPHLVDSGLRNMIQINIRGEAELTPGELFAVLRETSNSIRSLQLKAILKLLKTPLHDPALVEKAVQEMANVEKFKTLYPDIEERLESLNEKALDPEATVIDAITFGTFGAIHPKRVPFVIRQINDKQFEKFGAHHKTALAQAAGLSEGATFLLTQSVPQKHNWLFFTKGLEKSGGELLLRVNMTRKSGKPFITLHDTGLGEVYDEIAEGRFRSGKSAPFRKQVSDTRRFLGKVTRSKITLKRDAAVQA